ncbi:proline dehydrogenase family protein [Pseudochryseolinea flava]|uniref:Proline dehydrogenase n=1 Tax=Pseudochryseolinea flava TaxID=2059302 RepID=A0A364XVE2_9BACT|nr:proline dehydrogenase family protein [Pseudochryseolinea flava]RAV97672.1 proline dehydrogenase [Pseudochryseolinea flava]
MAAANNLSFDDTSVAFSYKSDAALKKANFIFTLVNNPTISALATSSVKLALKLHLPVEGMIKKTVFDHFCGGESIDKCDDEIASLAKYGVGTILDYSVEGEKSERGFDLTMEETLRTVEKAGKSQSIPFTVFKVTGLASSDLLEKVQSNAPLTKEEAAAYERVRERVNRICKRAYEVGIPVLVDAEETWIQEPIDDLAYEMMALYNRKKAIVFNTYQLYRTASLGNLKTAYQNAVKGDYHLGGKLVRGAYMEKERARAQQRGYESPIHANKEATDVAFNEALEFSMANINRMAIMCGSHNEQSNYLLSELMKKYNISETDERIWFAQLFGMSDNISFNLARHGYRVAKYVPYGPVRSVMPYLFRRAAENTSVAGQSSRELTLIRKELRRRKG